MPSTLTTFVRNGSWSQDCCLKHLEYTLAPSVSHWPLSNINTQEGYL